MFGGLFGGDKPDGTVSDAWRLLQTGKIGPGRELLRRLIKHEPSNFEALVLGLYEMTRPPLIQGEARRRAELLETLAPDCNEGRSVFVCATWTNPSELTYASYDKMSKSSPRCAHGSAFRLIATIAMCDTEIQHRCTSRCPATTPRSPRRRN